MSGVLHGTVVSRPCIRCLGSCGEFVEGAARWGMKGTLIARGNTGMLWDD